MLSAVTLSRSPPRADTTMIPTSDRSRICRHSSKPSASGSIRSSSTMSGSSVSSSFRTRMPSWETTVSKPRTARFDRIRSTMLGSSSTTRTRVLATGSLMLAASPGSGAGHQGRDLRQAGAAKRRHRRLPRRAGMLGGSGGMPAGLGGVLARLDREHDTEAGAGPQALQVDVAAVRFDDAVRDGQAEPGPSGAGAPPAARLERRGGEVVRNARSVVGHADHDLRRRRDNSGHQYPGPRRIVTERVADQVDDHLFQPVMISPNYRKPGIAPDRDSGGTGRRQAGDRGLKDQRYVTPVGLQPHQARFDRGEVEQVVDEAAEAGRLGRDAVEETVLGAAVPGHVGLHEAGSVAPDRGQRGPQLMAQPGQEVPLQLTRTAQRGGLLMREAGLLPVQREPQ